MEREKLFSGNLNLFSSCPSCSKKNVLVQSRSRNRIEAVIKALTWFELYRCKQCGWRGYKSRIVITGKNIRNVIIYILLMLLTSFIVYQVLKRIS